MTKNTVKQIGYANWILDECNTVCLPLARGDVAHIWEGGPMSNG